MSSLDFLRSLKVTQSQAAKAKIEAPIEKMAQMKISEPQKKSEKPKKQFIHGNNVIMRHGTYKGYYGYVYDDAFKPGRFEIEFSEEMYVPAESYGKREISDTIATDFGQSEIINVIPVLIGVFVQGMGEVRLPEDAIIRVVSYQKEDGIHFAKLNNVMSENGELVCNISDIRLDGKRSTRPELIKRLSDAIKAGKLELETDNVSVNCANLVFPELYFITKASEKKSEQNLLGYYGTLTRVIPEQYHIRYKKRMIVSNSSVKTEGKNTVIRRGPFKGKVVTIVNRLPARLTVYIDAIGRKITEHIVKKGDQFVHQPITPADVFYLDLKLRSGNYFEVKKITDDGKILGLEKNLNYGSFTPKEITMDDIESLQPGFSFRDTEGERSGERDTESEELEFVSDESADMITDEFDTTDETPTDESGMYAEGDAEGTGEEREFAFEAIEAPEEQEMKSAYADVSRTAYTQIRLSPAEEQIKTKVKKITKLFGINDNEIKLYTIIENVSTAIKKMKMELNKVEDYRDTWVESDERYIIASLVLYEIVRSGLSYLFVNKMDNVLGNYVENLIEGGFFKPKDLKQTFFLKPNWTGVFELNAEMIEVLIKQKNYKELHEMTLTNANKFMGTIFELPAINDDVVSSVVKLEDLIPLGQKSMQDFPKKYITIKDIMKGDPIPPTATKIIWGPVYGNILVRFKNALAAKIEESRNNETKVVYEYVLQNIEQAPFVLKTMEEILTSGPHLSIERKKFTKLAETWEKLLGYLRSQYTKVEERKEEKLSSKQKIQEERQKRRTEAMEMLGNFGDLSIEDEEEPARELTKSFKKMKMTRRK